MVRLLNKKNQKTQLIHNYPSCGITSAAAIFLTVSLENSNFLYALLSLSTQSIPRVAMPKLCSGFCERLPCIFSRTKIGRPAWTESGDKCLLCDDAKMTESCGTIRGRQNVTQSLKAFRAHYEEHNYVYNAAMMRVPDEWREKFHEEALKSKRGQPRQHRSAPAAAQGEKVGELWTTVLQHRKRAFKALGSTEVTAYKKRRTADRKRVAKKFFLDNQLPVPEAKDIATNEAGLPAARSSDRAAFVEHWCKFGSWGICRTCHSLQPRPLEPIDARRVAQAEITSNACKQCKGKKWVPQPDEIPERLRKLTMKMAKVLRPLDIDVGRVKKANNGYRIKSAMTRLSWSKLSVKDKIAQARLVYTWGL